MKLTIKHRGSAIAGYARYDAIFQAETIEEVRALSTIYEYEKEGLELFLSHNHTDVVISVGKWPDSTPPPPESGSVRGSNTKITDAGV